MLSLLKGLTKDSSCKEDEALRAIYHPPTPPPITPTSPPPFSLLCWSCTFLLSLIQTILVSHPVLFLLQIARRPGQHNPAPFFLYELIHPSVGQHSGSCHLFSVPFWPCWPSSFGMADSSHAEMWAPLPSPSVHRELAAGASIWKRPI